MPKYHPVTPTSWRTGFCPYMAKATTIFAMSKYRRIKELTVGVLSKSRPGAVKVRELAGATG
jgi:hypothetical protein